MNTITTNIILDIESRGILQTVEVTNQDAVCHVVRITPVSGGSAYAISSDVSCALKGTTPAGTTINNAGTKSDYYVDFKITQAMTATAGNYLCELQMTGSNNSRKVVPAFILCVKKDTVDDSAVAASDEYTALSAALSNIADVTAYDTRITNLETDMTTKAETSDLATKADVTSLNAYWQTIYPVGAIYMSVSSTSPATLFGGTWSALTDRFLIGAGSAYTAKTTGGETTHTLTVAEMPSHRHGASEGQFHAYTGTNGADTVSGGTNFKSIQYTAYVGDGGAHNNMPPYLAVYMWKRIA